MSNLLSIVEGAATEKAAEGFAELMAHVCGLYTCGESSSVSEFEGHELAESILYVLGLTEETAQQTIVLLSSDDPIAVWTSKRSTSEGLIRPRVLCATMNRPSGIRPIFVPDVKSGSFVSVFGVAAKSQPRTNTVPTGTASTIWHQPR